MAMSDDGQTTEILAALVRGDPGATDKLVPHVLEELKAIARRQFTSEHKDHTLQPTVIAQDAFMRLVGHRNVDWRSRAHFFAVAAVVMRRILVDHVRKRRARKNAEAEWLVSFATGAEDDSSSDVVGIDMLDAALTELSALNERQAKVVELRYFGGLTVEESAEVLNVSPRTIKADWRAAKAWLGMRLTKKADT